MISLIVVGFGFQVSLILTPRFVRRIQKRNNASVLVGAYGMQVTCDDTSVHYGFNSLSISTGEIRFHFYLDHIKVLTDMFETPFDGEGLASPEFVSEIWGTDQEQ